MPLKLTQYNDPAVLNRWADGIEQRLNSIKIPVPPKSKLPQFQTNHIINVTQNKLNLIAGSGITIASDSLGDTVISGTSTGDGLAHGTLPWESDPSFFVMREDFFPSSGQINASAIGTEAVTSCGFAISSTGFGSANTFYMGAPPNLGQLMWTNDATQAHCVTLAPVVVGSPVDSSVGNQITGFWSLLDYPSWQCSFIFKFDAFVQSTATTAFSTAGTSFYIGLSGDTRTAIKAFTLSRPRCYMGLRFDTDTNSPSINDSFFTLEIVNNPETSGAVARNNTQGASVKVTDVAPVAGVWHRLDIICTTAGTVTLTLDGSSTNTLTAAMPKTTVTTVANNPAASSTNHGAIINWSTTSTAPIGNWARDTKLHVAGITDAGYTVLNGDWLVSFATEGGIVEYHITGADVGNGNLTSVATLSGYPALMPFMTAGNDNTVVSPTMDDKAFFIDYFSLLWNPGVNSTNALVPDPTKSRYF